MAIVVKGMEMPKGCSVCPMWTQTPIKGDWFDYCKVLKTTLDNPSIRPSECPLEEAEVIIKSNADDGGDIKEIVEYLNLVSGSSYRVSTPKTRTLIRARMKEGFSVEDFKTVIDKKVRDWSGDAKMQKFLRPETLFGTKFEGYLNEQEVYRLKGNKAKENSFQRVQRLMQEGAFDA